MKTKFILPSILLLIALAPLPYGYYYILKFAICIASVMELVELNDKNNNNSNLMIAFGFLIVLYNPLISIPIGKSIWTVVNILTILFFIYYSKKRI